MIIRQACASDAEAICDIWNAAIRDTMVTFTTEEKNPTAVRNDIATRKGAFQVAEEQGKVIGFATYFPFRSGPGYARTKEHSIQLDTRARGRGVGRSLMQALEDVAVSESVHSLWAGVSGANPGGEEFHRRLGFAQVARLPQVGYKNGQWLDLVLMQKFLTAPASQAPDTADRKR